MLWCAAVRSAFAWRSLRFLKLIVFPPLAPQNTCKDLWSKYSFGLIALIKKEALCVGEINWCKEFPGHTHGWIDAVFGVLSRLKAWVSAGDFVAQVP